MTDTLITVIPLFYSTTSLFAFLLDKIKVTVIAMRMILSYQQSSVTILHVLD